MNDFVKIFGREGKRKNVTKIPVIVIVMNERTAKSNSSHETVSTMSKAEHLVSKSSEMGQRKGLNVPIGIACVTMTNSKLTSIIQLAISSQHTERIDL